MKSSRAPDVRHGRVFLGCVVAVAWMLALPNVANADPEVKLKWTLGHHDGEHLVAVTQDVEVAGGTQIWMLVIPESQCYVYVLRVDGEGRVHRLFPALAELGKPPKAYQKLYIPKEWLRLGNGPAPETIHLVASATPLESLEALIRQGDSASEEARTAIDPKVVEEIKRLHREARLKSSKAVSMGGGVRGSGGLDSLDGNEATAEGMLIRSYTIDYR